MRTAADEPPSSVSHDDEFRSSISLPNRIPRRGKVSPLATAKRMAARRSTTSSLVGDALNRRRK